MPGKLSSLFLLPLLLLPARAQTNDPAQAMAQVLKRLDALESENRRLSEELHSLKQELAATHPAADTATPSQQLAASPPGDAPSLEERVDVSERRLAEQAQTKVETSQKFPLSLNGMLLFNAFSSSEGSLYSSYSPFLQGASRDGATVGQSIIGLQFQGPSLPGQGRVNGSLTMEFLGTPENGDAGWFHIREGDISLNWKDRSVSFGLMKPLISPLQPTSLAEVAISPLAGAGNLWYWLPQARYEERLHIGSQSGVNLAGAVMQTNESAAIAPLPYSSSLEGSRPAVEGRAAFWRRLDESRRLEIGAGFHASTSHVAGGSVPSRIASLDWSLSLLSKLQWSGSFYSGRNVASLGSLRNGFYIAWDGSPQAVHTTAGWSQFAIPVTSRLTFHFFGGIESDRDSPGVARNFTYASNLMYHLGPNVVFGAEALQSRFRSYNGERQLVDHYDLALAYLF
jgi:hypothetical protein